MSLATVNNRIDWNNEEAVHYAYDGGVSFRIDGYEQAPGFCGFLPGIAGEEGVPLWCMYVNRGQSVVSFGVDGKDGAIAEFLPANWAYQMAGLQGFRTFCLIDNCFYEPFQQEALPSARRPERTMWVRMDSIRLLERNPDLGLEFEVEYFSPIGRPLASLVRTLRLRNIAEKDRNLTLLDGLPVILPAGFTDHSMKHTRHIAAAYARVEPVAGGGAMFCPKVQAHDEPEVLEVKSANFYAAWCSEGDSFTPLELVVDPDIVFGGGQDLRVPRGFIDDPGFERQQQVWENRIPCALARRETVLRPGEACVVTAVAGGTGTRKLIPDFLAACAEPENIQRWARESSTFFQTLTDPAATFSADPILDAYSRQNFLDNVLRGGVPKLLPSADGPRPIHLYSRRHGDLERDYNDFRLAPHPLSDGPGNYRDICQNRRYDLWFYPEVGDTEIRAFLGLIQADGYNPLSVTGYRWNHVANSIPDAWAPTADSEARREFEQILARPFAPGELLAWHRTYCGASEDATTWMLNILKECSAELVAHGHEGGFWIDHWIYIVDMLEAYKGLYPDRIRDSLTQRADVGWFDEGAFVVPRSEKYRIRPNGPLQLHAVKSGVPAETPLPPVVPLAKLTALLAVKAVSLDFAGKGVEMEAGRPGWNDSLNGLPALFGSSTCETAAAARLARWLLDTLDGFPDCAFPEVVADFIDTVEDHLIRPYDWATAADIRETYRETLRQRQTSAQRSLDGQKLRALVDAIEQRMSTALNSSIRPETGLAHTYFIGVPKTKSSNEARAEIDAPVEIAAFENKPLPLFLEGQVHLLRQLSDDPERARRVYRAVRESALFDRGLRMYKLNECIDALPQEIGRTRTFSRGWFENESIWLHMSYKYLLELLRTGLYDEFFEDASTMLVPFMDPAQYGRSTLENSSFIACSECPDPKARGRGFIARLSGTTAEYIHMSLLLTVGAKPFILRHGELCFSPKPVLPASWFARDARCVSWKSREFRLPESSFACAFLGKTLLVYRNESRRDTFGAKAVRPSKIALGGGEPFDIAACCGESAERVRACTEDRIDVWLE